MTETDVLIVGAGPAGCVAALNLAPLRRVTLVERRPDAAARIGESLPPAARRLLADMGLWEAFRAQGHAPCHANRAAWGGDAWETDLLRDPDGHGWHLDRTRFEQWLRGVAEERGAELVTARLDDVWRDGDAWRVCLTEPRCTRTVRAGAIIDAGGRSAPVARRLGARVTAADRLMCGWLRGRDRRSAAAGVTLVEAESDGWWYSAPLPGGERVVAFHTDWDLPAARVARARDLLGDRAQRTPQLGALLREAGFATVSSGSCAANSARLEPCAGAGWLAVGDAALAFDPLSSQGLLNALFTGLAGAEAVDRMLKGTPGAAADYRAAIADVQRAYRAHLEQWYAVGAPPDPSAFWQRRLAALTFA